MASSHVASDVTVYAECVTSSVVVVGCGECPDDDGVRSGGADAVDDEHGVLEAERLKQAETTTLI